MHPNLLKPFYSHGPIQNLDTLAEVLEISCKQLCRLARKANQMYRLVPQQKKDGSVRKTYDADHALKRVQHLIKTRILSKVRYPLYLQGGIRDPENPRDYARNAAIHAGQACVINEDIADFYPSTTSHQVRDIWKHFFRFPAGVADCLTRLTTRRGFLPQGAKTSSYLANLVFWRTEYELVRHLAAKGLRYSRLADDITVSSSKPLTRGQKSEVISAVYSFIKRDGFSPKYRKHAIFERNEAMLVNNLVVNAHPALPVRERQAVRCLVHRASNTLNAGNGTVSNVPLAHIKGKIGKVKRFHARAGRRLAATLQAALTSVQKLDGSGAHHRGRVDRDHRNARRYDGHLHAPAPAGS